MLNMKVQQPLTWTERVTILSEASCGLAYLHGETPLWFTMISTRKLFIHHAYVIYSIRSKWTLSESDKVHLLWIIIILSVFYAF